MPLRLRLLVPFLCSTLACAGGGAPGGAPPVFPDPTHEEMRAALLSLVDQQLYEPMIVRRGLVGPAEVRRATAEAIGRIGDPDGLEALYALLVDDDAEVRRDAAFALGEVMEAPELIASEGEARVRAAARLLEAVGDPDREVGRLAVEALGKAGVSIGTVAGRLGEMPDEEERWARVLPALFRFPEPASVRLAVDFLGRAEEAGPAGGDGGDGRDGSALRRRAVYALTREPLPEALPHVRPLLSDPDPRVRAWAARALGRIGDASDLPRLAPLLSDHEAAPLVHAMASMQALASGPGAAAWRPRTAPLVAARLADARPHVRMAALDAAAAWLPEPTVADRLVEIGRGGAAFEADGAEEAGPASWERGAALMALATGGDPWARELTDELAGSDDPVLRAAATEAAGVLADGSLLEILADDREPRVRQAAVAALLALAEGAEAERLAGAALRDPDAGVRTTVLGWLVERPVLPAATLAAVLEPGGPDGAAGRSIEERLTAVDALAALAAGAASAASPAPDGSAATAVDRAADPAVASLIETAEAGELPLRRRAADALAGLGLPRPDPGHHATRSPLGVYRSILHQAATPRTVELVTRHGVVTLRIDCPRAPLTCVNFLQLVGQGFYDGLAFHRVVPDFVVQGGDPRGDGWGGPGYTVRDEIGRLRYERGVVGMALAGPDTGGSQFFVTLAPQPHLDGGYTAFGEVVAGLEALDRIEPGDRILAAREVP